MASLPSGRFLWQSPEISRKIVERAMAEMLKNGEIIKIGGGRYTSYTWNWEKE